MFADAVIRLHTDEATWTRLSRKAPEFARENFSFESIARFIRLTFVRY